MYSISQALRFLKANLSEDDLHALLEKLQIKDTGAGSGVSVETAAANQVEKLISVSELAKLAEAGDKSDGASTAPVSKDSVQIHTR